MGKISTTSVIRFSFGERYGLGIFRGFFEKVVQMCAEAGLVWGKELYFNATKVDANA